MLLCIFLGNYPVSEFYVPTFRNTLFHLRIYPPMKMEQTECSEMSAYKIQKARITQKKAYNIGLFACHELRYLVGNKLCVSIQMSVEYDVLSFTSVFLNLCETAAR